MVVFCVGVRLLNSPFWRFWARAVNQCQDFIDVIETSVGIFVIFEIDNQILPFLVYRLYTYLDI